MTRKEMIERLNESEIKWRTSKTAPATVRMDDGIYQSRWLIMLLASGEYSVGWFEALPYEANEGPKEQRAGFVTLTSTERKWFLKADELVAWAELPTMPAAED